ncbi:CopG family transcriptional regulator [Mesorhizobium sp. B2-1-4]|nr:CopG family transcriptional regulator [Mesorhizobium sp. B2-5-1]TPM65352.1 CopG family transcriptional regulator [Mesorhizobium sp. B2-1-9]TPM83955.1 CopG family transcriptional regulator [Mesorhizobium sp. B2-1-4]TPN14062.1 CopG family transcriptional regulator [Mesorhizobium sp. B2-1-2]
MRLSAEIEQRLDSFVARTDRSKVDCLRELIQRGLDDVEDYDLAAEAAGRIGRGEEDIMKADDFWRGLYR